MGRLTLPIVLAPVVLVGCAAHHGAARATLADLHDVRPDLQDVKVEQGLDQAMESYRRFLEETPQTAMTPEAIRRLADLQLEKQFGIRTGDRKPGEMAAPEKGRSSANAQADASSSDAAVAAEDLRESEHDFEQRAATVGPMPPDGGAGPAPAGLLPAGANPAGPLEAISLYEKLLKEYPSYENSDQVLYQMSRAYDELGRTEEAMATMDRLIRANPNSPHLDEVQFRRGEYFFTRRRYREAESAYSAILGLGPRTSYYELALYKLGWTLYKQEFYDEALQKYMALLDFKVSTGYDFDQTHTEDEDRRIADTFRVISLAFSNLGGPENISEFFSSYGRRAYEDRIYSNLGEHYLAKLRYDDAAKTFKAFVAINPFHRSAPRFSMRVVETFTQGGFPKLVLEAKREFASRYGLQAEYWRHNKPEESPEVLAYLKANLKDLATHYHAQYQSAEKAEEKLANYREALQWYGDYLKSFPADAESPSINYRLADLHLENKDFGEAAKQYERTAYEYPAHAQSSAAGYAAVYAHRELLKITSKEQLDAVKQETVASSLRFADAFPDDEHAAAVLGAAADDMFEMKNYKDAISSAQRVIDKYPGAEKAIRRSAWIVVGHGSFELAEYPQAERAYAEVLTATPEGDESRPGFVENLAASIYKQGELARNKKDYRAAADHFLRIRSAAPTAKIRATAEYDAGAALFAVQDWNAAADVLDAFRRTFPKHEMLGEATRLIARAYKESGQLSRAAGEYDRLASQSTDPALRGEAMLAAGDLYEQSKERDRALDVYARYVKEFPHPVETALETRLKIAEIHKAANDEPLYRQELKEIVSIDAAAGQERTVRTRTIAARSALVLAEQLYGEYVAVKLRQPFEASLKEKKERMNVAIDAMDGLVEYEIADVTAAATYYMAETYADLSVAMKESERPTNLNAGEMQEYEDALDEAAFPFEEKAIALHTKNLEMMQGGVSNAWTEKSLGRLAELMPGRYKKDEVSSGFLDAIDTYVYRTPGAPPPGPPPTKATTNTPVKRPDKHAPPVEEKP